MHSTAAQREGRKVTMMPNTEPKENPMSETEPKENPMMEEAETEETPIEETETEEAEAEEADQAETDEAETFPRAYVERLRKESAAHRERAKRADDLARQLFTARVAATGRLADPNDLPFAEAILNDAPAMDAAIDELLADHPHYAARRPRGDVGQGASQGSGSVDLAGLLRGRA